MSSQRFHLPADPASCRETRAIVARLETRLPVAVVGDLTVVADELVVQAVLASANRGTLALEVVTNGHEITVAVEDEGTGFPIDNATPGEDGSVGLAIVERLADRWGLERRGAITRSWATLSIPTSSDAVAADPLVA